MKSLDVMKGVSFEGSNCYVSQLSTVANWWLETEKNVNTDICFLGSWNFRYQRKGTIGESIFVENRQPDYMKVFYGIEVYECMIAEEDKKFSFIKQELSAGRPVIIRMISRTIPWDPNLWDRDESTHVVIVNGIDEEKQEFSIVDAYYNKENEKLPFDNFRRGIRDKLIAFRFYQPQKKIEEISCKSFIEEALQFHIQGETDSFSAMRDLAEDFLNEKEVEKEIASEKNYVGSNLYRKILAVINGRKQFASFLRLLSIENNIEKLNEVAACMEIASEMWHTIQLLIVKYSLMKKYDKFTHVSEEIIKVADYEETIYNQLKEMISGEGSITDNETKTLDSIITIPIEGYCNSKAFGELSIESKANIFNIDSVPEYERNRYMEGACYFYKEDFPSEGKIHYKGIEFDLIDADESGYDNIRCTGQEIPMDAPNKDTILLIGCSSLGTYSGELKIHFFDGSSKSMMVGFTDWWIKPLLGEQIVMSARAVSQQEGKVEMAYGERYLFLAKIQCECIKGIKSIKLPDCGNIHIFSILAGQEKGL